METNQLLRIKRKCNNNFGGFSFNKTCNFNSLPIEQHQKKQLVALELKQNLDRCSKADNLSLTICDPNRLTEEALRLMPTEQIQRIKQRCDNNFSSSNLGTPCDYSALPIAQHQKEKLLLLENYQNLQRCLKTDNLSLTLCVPSQLSKKALEQMSAEQIERIRQNCLNNPFITRNSARCSAG